MLAWLGQGILLLTVGHRNTRKGMHSRKCTSMIAIIRMPMSITHRCVGNVLSLLSIILPIYYGAPIRLWSGRRIKGRLRSKLVARDLRNKYCLIFQSQGTNYLDR